MVSNERMSFRARVRLGRGQRVGVMGAVRGDRDAAVKRKLFECVLT